MTDKIKLTEKIKCPTCGSEDGRSYYEECYCFHCSCKWDESKRQPVNAWIPCSERLPKVWQDVLYCDVSLGYVASGCMDENGDWWVRGVIGEFVFDFCTVVTHWQPRPQPPAAGKDVE